MSSGARGEGGGSDRIPVAPADELGPGERAVIEADGVEIGVFNVDGEYYALRNSCPHREGPICDGKITNALVGEWPGVGERIHERLAGDPAIACPWHGWEFDMDTGAHLGDDTFAVQTYDVVVEDGIVYVER